MPQLVVGSGGWDRRFLELAKHFATWSKDPSTKVGCVIVGSDKEIVSTGFNGFPRGILDTDDRLTHRETKYELVCHAEENAILHAARLGVKLKDCVLFCTWPPCTSCARKIVQVGIKEVVYPEDIEVPERWAEVFKLSQELFEEAEVTVRRVKLEEPSKAIEVYHCEACKGVTFDATVAECRSCGHELHPSPKTVFPNRSYQFEDLRSNA